MKVENGIDDTDGKWENVRRVVDQELAAHGNEGEPDKGSPPPEEK